MRNWRFLLVPLLLGAGFTAGYQGGNFIIPGQYTGAAVDGGNEVYGAQLCNAGGCFASVPQAGYWKQDSALDLTPTDAGVGITLGWIDAGTGVIYAGLLLLNTPPTSANYGEIIFGNSAAYFEYNASTYFGGFLASNYITAPGYGVFNGGISEVIPGYETPLVGYVVSDAGPSWFVENQSPFAPGGIALEIDNGLIANGAAVSFQPAGGNAVVWVDGGLYSVGPLYSGNVVTAGSLDAGGLAVTLDPSGGPDVRAIGGDSGVVIIGNCSAGTATCAELYVQGSANEGSQGLIASFANGTNEEATIGKFGYLNSPGVIAYGASSATNGVIVEGETTAAPTKPAVTLENATALTSGEVVEIKNGGNGEVASFDYNGSLQQDGGVIQQNAAATGVTLNGNCGTSNSCVGLLIDGNAGSGAYLDGGSGAMIMIQRGYTENPLMYWDGTLNPIGQVLQNSFPVAAVYGFDGGAPPTATDQQPWAIEAGSCHFAASGACVTAFKHTFANIPVCVCTLPTSNLNGCTGLTTGVVMAASPSVTGTAGYICIGN